MSNSSVAPKIPAMFKELFEPDLVSEIRSLRAEVQALSALLNPPASIILIGPEALAAYKKLSI